MYKFKVDFVLNLKNKWFPDQKSEIMNLWKFTSSILIIKIPNISLLFPYFGFTKYSTELKQQHNNSKMSPF